MISWRSAGTASSCSPSASRASISYSSAAARNSSSRTVSATAEGAARQVLERLAAPEAERGPQFLQGNVGVDRPRRREPRGRCADEELEAVGVERVGLDVEEVSGTHRAQRRPVGARSQPDGAAQVGHLHLQGVDGIGEHLLAPDLLDEGVHGSHLPQPQQQRRQQGERSSLPEGEQAPIVPHLEGAEDRELHRGEGNDGQQIRVSDLTAGEQGVQRSSP